MDARVDGTCGLKDALSTYVSPIASIDLVPPAAGPVIWGRWQATAHYAFGESAGYTCVV